MHGKKERKKRKEKRKERKKKQQKFNTHTHLSNKEIHSIFKTEIIVKQMLITYPQWLKHSEYFFTWHNTHVHQCSEVIRKRTEIPFQVIQFPLKPATPISSSITTLTAQ